MLQPLLLFFASAAAIYWACDYFVNGIEWCGRRLNVGATAVGTVLAAFGTALPESAVTFVAVALGKTPAEQDVGVGAAMGGPLVLATLAYAVVGLALLTNRHRLKRPDLAVQVDCRRLARDQGAFLAIFAVKVGLGLVAFAYKPWLGGLFILCYALYVWMEIRDGETSAEETKLQPLKCRPQQAEPALGWAVAQVTAALAVVSAASHVFVGQLAALGSAAHLPPHLIALLLSPVATELPETLNAVIWVRQGKERLALGNISGAMMIQATIPSALGIIYTPWRFDSILLAAGIATAAAVGFLWLSFRQGHVNARKLMGASAFYVAFWVYLIRSSGFG
jgi:cation:H+ antiporter